ncbi:MAG: DUF2769 domain-containing protein [Methanosarcina flavescens]|jgi:hypothetical protein
MGRNTSIEEGSPIPPRDRNVTFERSMNFLVPYKRANINRCRCPQCPVQADSQCAQAKIKSSKQSMENLPEGEVPDPEDFPGVYCSEGEATCSDLDPDRQCICGSCEVWKEYDLKDANPNNHFCHNGRAT